MPVSAYRVQGVYPQALGGLVISRDLAVASVPSGYGLLASRIFQGATTGDLGRTAGAKSITPAGGLPAETWTLVNGTAAFLAADPNGLFIDANGLNMQSGSSISTGQWNGAVSGPYIYKLVSEMVPASLWASTSLALANLYTFVDFIWIVDASSANANNEYMTCGVGGTSAFITGASGRSGWGGGVAALGGATQSSVYTVTGVTSANIGFPGSAQPTAIRVRVNSAGQEIALGLASGLTPPSAWYSKDSFSQTAQTNSVSTTGTALNKDMVACWGIEDATGGGAFTGIVKALYIKAQRPAPGNLLSVAV